jgi:hypothetical protein
MRCNYERRAEKTRGGSKADEFYATVIPSSLDADSASIMRQALAGMSWTKQFYYYDVDRWLEEHGADPFRPVRNAPRNDGWHHMFNADIISMPDKWEYPRWRDCILFYEYFHGDNGAGIGASHQTGWTGIVARIMHLFATTTAERALSLGKR